MMIKKLIRSISKFFTLTNTSSATRLLGVFLLIGGLLLLPGGETQAPFSLPNPEEIVSSYVDNPSEQKPTDEQERSFKVPGIEPRLISMPSINTRGIVQKIGILENNAIAVPANVHFAGWYSLSAHPGSEGLSIIDGHVSGKKSDGIFKNIGNLKTGEMITIEYGDYSKKQFEVKSVNTVDEEDAIGLLFRQDSTIASQLNLITCSGKFDRATQNYTKRIIVVTSLVK